MVLRAVSRSGLTLLETIVVMGIVVALVAVGIFVARPSAVDLDAQALASSLRAQRWRAVQGGLPVVVRADNANRALFLTQGVFSCDSMPLSATAFTARPNVTLTWPSSALAFDSDGRARRCDGGGAGNTTIGLTDRRGNQAAVIVATLGRVRWERR